MMSEVLFLRLCHSLELTDILEELETQNMNEYEPMYIRGGMGIIPGTESRVCYFGFDTGPDRV